MLIRCPSGWCTKGPYVRFSIGLIEDSTNYERRYIATLESRIQTLENQLRAKDSAVSPERNQPGSTPEISLSETHSRRRDAPVIDHVDFGSPIQKRGNSSSGITVLDMLHDRAFSSDLKREDLPVLPSSHRARDLVDTVYFYTQARYCIIDWIQLREWHRDREAIAYSSTESPVTSQIGA
ncbi:hypothetical protein PHISCL_00855 [Aspergillus sclerotialis]|uniref:Uncharacterized protein n=1 Tax=Aspergillus sclerotialis TaxID=2070753 RepID=A0A3A2ZVS4_9EURO|nr:hypothetical protein PHISCL_00855 [Aspergillus sclerotialis]